MEFCFLNNKIIPVSQAFISLDDIGLLRGYGVFDFLRTYNGKPFLLKEHLKRLTNSAEKLSLKVPLTEQKIEAVIDELLKKNQVKEAQVRILLTGGRVVNGMEYDTKSPTFAILIEPLALPPSEVYKKGAKLITDIHMRQVYAAKTTNYINAVALTQKKKANKAIELLYVFNDFVLECSTSNFFIFKGNTLITPKNNILLGTTRNFLLKLVRKDFQIEERDIAFNELQEADEAFITATNKEVLPIVQIDKMIIGSGRVGKNTVKIMKKFAAYTKNF